MQKSRRSVGISGFVVSEKSEGSLIAKIGAREEVYRGQVRKLRFDQSHLHVFDKATECTLTVTKAK